MDGVDEIAVQGRDVGVRHLEAQPLRNPEYRFSASLPSQPVEVTLRQIKGRGRVRLMEQPSERNGFTAVVRIEDPKGGDDRYEFELTWDEDWDDDFWDPDRLDGVFHWEGRVDIGADIEIQGDSHVVKDRGGQGTIEYTSRFESSLPATGVALAIDKLDGRGEVDLIQAPSAENDYTAIVRIEDDDSGPDRYKFELRWRE